MNLLLLKLILTPALIGLASLAGRRWGHAISGWVVALPLTTGPIVFFLALTHGPAFAADAAVGVLTGGLSLVVFTILYAHLAPRWFWLPALLVSSAAFLIMTAILRPIQLPPAWLWVAVLAALYLSLRLLPRIEETISSGDALPGFWDIPLRMLIATIFVFFITGLAPAVGPHLAGLLTPFPIFTATLTAFAQHQHGATPVAIRILRGLLLGLFSYESFLLVLALLLIPAGILVAFAAAILVVIVLQAGSLWLLQRGIG